MTPASNASLSVGRIASLASGNTTTAFTPLETMPWMSEMDFCRSPWPSAYTNSLTLGHFAASWRPDSVVTRRQLLPPKPSRRPITASFGPHHDGTSDAGASEAGAASDAAGAASEAAGAALDSLLVDEEPHAASASAATPTPAIKMTLLRLRVICSSLLFWGDACAALFPMRSSEICGGW